MKKIFNYFTKIAYSYFSNKGDKILISASGFFTDFYTILMLMVLWYVGFDVLGYGWVYDPLGILLVYFIGRVLSIFIVLLHSETSMQNKRKRYIKAGLWLLVPYSLIFLLSFFGDEDVEIDNPNTWESE